MPMRNCHTRHKQMGPLPKSSQKIGIDIHAMRNGTAVEVAKRLIKFVTRFGLTDQI
jgi:hypothetical protein